MFAVLRCSSNPALLTQTLKDENLEQWANKKGFPPIKDFSPRVQVSRYHAHCLLSDQDSSYLKHTKGFYKQQQSLPSASTSRPWTIYTGLQPEKLQAEPDLRDCVTVWRESSSRQVQYVTQWDSTPRPAPDLPLDVLERVLFPRAFPSRIVSPRHFEPENISAVQHRGRPQGRSTSPWTEVAMHLVEGLEPGHYWPSNIGMKLQLDMTLVDLVWNKKNWIYFEMGLLMCRNFNLFILYFISENVGKSQLTLTKYRSTPPLQLNMTKLKMLHTPDTAEQEGEKTSVKWVTCHTRLPALSLTPAPEGTDSGSRWGLVNSLCVTVSRHLKVCTRLVVLSFSFPSSSTSHLTVAHSSHWPQPLWLSDVEVGFCDANEMQ